MATGDTSLTANPDGSSVSLTIAGFTRGATYAFGLGTNSVPGANTPYLTVVSLGYDATGAATMRTRLVWLDKVMRFPFSTLYLTGTGTPFTGSFVDGETVTGSISGKTALVVGNQSSGTRLYVKCPSGAFNAADLFTGATGTFLTTTTGTTPADGTLNEQVGTAGLTVQIALSDYVFIKDNTGGGNSGTAPTFTAPAAFVTNSGGSSETSAVATAAAITQSSAAVYPKVVANWTWPGYQRITGDFTLRCFAAHGTSVFSNLTTQVGAGQMNIAAVVFSAADTHSHTATATVAAPTYDSTMADANPVVEFIGTISVSTLTALDVLTCNFIAYPLIGDSGAIVDSSAGTAQPTPLVGPITQVNDKSNTYGRTFCAVSSAGDDTTGAAVDRASYGSDALADAGAILTPCKTIGGAYAKIVAYNLANHAARNDGGAGEILLLNESYSWVGAGSAFGVKPGCWPIIRPSNGITAAQALINDQAGDSNLKHVVKMQGVTIGNNGGSYPYFYPCDSLWFDQCIMSSTGAAVLNDDCKAFYVTRCTMAGFAQGLRPFGAANTAPKIVRGNNLNGFTKQIQCYTVVGNSKTTKSTAAATLFSQDISGGQVQPPAVNSILAFNSIKGIGGDVIAVDYQGFYANSVGCAIVQNLFEICNGTGGSALADIASTGALTPNNNYILWNNTNVGQRILRAFDFHTGNTPIRYRVYWSEKNNNFQICSIVADLPQDDAGNGARTGAWTTLFGTANSGNLTCVPSWSSTGGMLEFAGASSISPARNGATNPDGYQKFVDFQAYNGAGDATGLGNYHLLSTSPAVGLQRELLVPYDLDGLARSASNEAAGAYKYTATSSGVGFWWP